MSPPRVLLDSSVPQYALGAQSRWRTSCRDVLSAITIGRLDALASAEMVREVVHHRLRMTNDPGRAVADARDVALLASIVAFDEAVLLTALELIAESGIRGRDAVHAATALTRGVRAIISTDPAFDAVPHLERVEPADVEDWAARQ